MVLPGARSARLSSGKGVDVSKKKRAPAHDTIDPWCIECGKLADRLVPGDMIYPHLPNLKRSWFVQCECGAYVGCHPGTTIPMGRPAGRATLALRSKAHNLFDPFWQRDVIDLGASRRTARKAAYSWLAGKLGLDPSCCHIGWFDANQLNSVIEVCLQRREDERCEYTSPVARGKADHQAHFVQGKKGP